MNEDAMFSAGVVLIAATILLLEWRYQFKSLRLVAAMLALATLLGLQPAYHTAWRVAISTPPAERVTRWDTLSDSAGQRLSEYQSGVFTMRRAMVTVGDAHRRERWLMVGVLFWLACSPIFRRASDHVRERTGA